MLRRCLGLILLAPLIGCTSLTVLSHVPVSTMSRLSKMTVADIDPEELRVAARLPDALEPQPHGVKVSLEIRRPGRQPQTENLALERATQPDELAPVEKWARSGFRLWVYRLAPADVSRLKHLMSEKGSAPGTSRLTISAGVAACRLKPLGSAALPTTTLLRTNATGYFVLTKNLDIRSLVSKADLAAKVPPC